jgi:Coenzyme PQQ synthesis protein D (PqqD)
LTDAFERLYNRNQSIYDDARTRSSPVGDICVNNPKQIDGLDISPAEDGYIVYTPEHERVHFLNATAVLILELCNGRHSAEQIIELVKDAYGLPEPPVDMVNQALGQLQAEGLLV